MAFCFYGLVIHSESVDELNFLLETAVVVDNGKVFATLTPFFFKLKIINFFLNLCWLSSSQLSSS